VHMSRDDAMAVFIALDSNGDGQMSQQVRGTRLSGADIPFMLRFACRLFEC
jgi:hypothetical protein